MNITDKQTTLFFRRFCVGRMDAYGTYYKDSLRYNVIREPVTVDVARKHLTGTQPLGIYPVRERTVRFAVIDCDTQDTQVVKSAVDHLAKCAIPAYVEISKGKGYHIWIFFEADVSAEKVIRLFRGVLEAIGATDTELFPKQAEVPADGLGNFINLPLAGHLVCRGKTLFLDSHFRPYPNQWTFLEELQLIPESMLDSQLLRVAGNSMSRISRNSISSAARTDDSVKTFGLLPCARRMLSEGVTVRQRVSAFRLAVALKKAGVPLDLTVSALLKWAKKNKPDDGRGIITPSEIEEQVSCAYRKAYAACGCNDEAVLSFCDPTCRLKQTTLRETRNPKEKERQS